MRTPILTLAVSALILTGCSTTVVFESDIEGALVTTVAGQQYGVTPVAISFSNDDLDASRDIDGCARILGVTYTWPSGAKASSPNPIVLCGENSRFRYILKRPADAPNVEKDLQYALQRARQREAQLQAELEMERFYNDRMMLWGPFMWGPPPPMHRPPPPPPPPRR